MREISSALNTEVIATVTTPAFFVEMLFSSPVRFSSRGTLDWNGSSWEARAFQIQGIGHDVSTPQQSGTLSLGDLDGSVTALVLREGIAGKTINVWKFYGTDPAPEDPVQIFAGAGDTASMEERSGVISITLVQRGALELYAPRRYMTRANGFSILPVTGSVIAFNGQRYKLERYRG